MTLNDHCFYGYCSYVSALQSCLAPYLQGGTRSAVLRQFTIQPNDYMHNPSCLAYVVQIINVY